MSIQGLIFDFDGLIIDTESPEYYAWKEACQEYGVDLPLDEWVKCVGASFNSFNPFIYLQERSELSLDREQIERSVRARATELVASEQIRPGVLDLIDAARAQGLKLAVASSSPRSWVHGHLQRIGMLELFDTICTGDQVEQVKPDPDLYLLALERLGLKASEGIAFEDSPNGASAAKAAGLFTVAIPNGVTGHLSINHADLVIKSMAEYSLQDLLLKAETNHN